ncbi:MAG: dCMP deaminase [Pseudonocardia sp.]|nr:dCMP deaminase [Pseudonocardia sp.]
MAPVDDRQLLRRALTLAGRCPPSATFRVGALVVAADGPTIAEGGSGRRARRAPAEESARADAADDPRLAGATIYSSLEPCSTRASRPASCTQLILDAGIPRVVYAWREPALFVDCEGDELLRAAGREVVELSELARLVRAANTHLPGVAP